ncbi:MAG: hypothetical protein Q9160_003902 [Pyrenula sp. 1 TL-2023]
MDPPSLPGQGREERSSSGNARSARTIDLTILSPNAIGIPNNRILLLDLPVTIDIAHLKELIRQEVPSHPQPDRQRLIYRGKPLLDATITLAELFSPEITTSIPQTSFTIHLVLPPPNTSTSHQPSRSSSAPPQQVQYWSTNFQNGANQAPPLAGQAQHPPPIAQLQAQQNLAHEIMRNQIEMMHRNFMPQNTFVQQGGGAIFNTGQQFPGQFPGAQVPGPFAAQQEQPFRQNAAHQFSNQPNNQGSQGGNIPTTNTVQPGAPAASMAQNLQSTSQSDLPRNPMRPGEANSATAGNPAQVPPPSSDPTSTSERQGHRPAGHASATQNGPLPNHTTVQETIGPNGERTRTVTSNQTFNIQMQSRTSTPPFQRPGNPPHPNASRSGTPNRPAESMANAPPNVGPQNRPNPVLFNPMMTGTGPSGLPPPPMFPPFPIANGGLHFPFQGPQPGMMPQPNSTTTTAWLLNGPGGPQGFLLSPEHGFFSTPLTTNITNPRIAAMRPFMHSRRVRPHAHQPQTHAQNQGQPQQPAAADPAQNPNPNVPIQAPLVQPQNEQQQEQQQAEAEQRNILELAWNRVWLFVRLYLFTFLLGGNRGWMRWFWLALTIIWCVMPETTIIRDLWRRIQRHVENLLPLAPHPRQRQNNDDQQQTQHDNADQRRDNSATTSDASATSTNTTQQQQQQGGSSSGRPRTPTPSEAADRLRRDHHNRQVTWISDLVTRIESGLALFLASLIPGLPERHFEARNELAAAERVIEEERRANEERERALREEQEREQGTLASGEGAAGDGSGAAGMGAADEGVAGGDDDTGTGDGTGDRDETNRVGGGGSDPRLRQMVKAMSSVIDPAHAGEGEGSGDLRQRQTQRRRSNEASGDGSE